MPVRRRIVGYLLLPPTTPKALQPAVPAFYLNMHWNEMVINKEFFELAVVSNIEAGEYGT